MAEMLICTVDAINPDPALDCMCYKRGDVIEIMVDGHGWGVSERRNAERVIIEFPGVDEELLTGFLAPEPGDPMKNLYLKRRAFGFDLDNYNGQKTAQEALSLLKKK